MQMQLKDVDVAESGETVVPATFFAHMLGTMSGLDVEVGLTEKVLKFTSSHTTVRTHTLDPENFPKAKMKFPDETTRVSGLAFLAKKPAAIANERSNSEVCKGVQISFSPETSSASATDGARFLRVKGENVADRELELFVPESAMNMLCGIVKPKDELYVGVLTNTAVFHTADFVFTTMLINGNLSGVEKTMSKFVTEYKATVNAKELLSTLDLCMTLTANTKTPCIDVAVTDDSVMVFVDNENGTFDHDISAKNAVTMGEKLFHYNPKYLYDFVRDCSGELELLFTDRGALTMKCGLMECVVMARTAVAKVEPTQNTKAAKSTETKPKAKKAITTKKGKNAEKPETEAA
jgi:DNA polymerase III sliding clamp (beta) subunit (PCNA family)